MLDPLIFFQQMNIDFICKWNAKLDNHTLSLSATNINSGVLFFGIYVRIKLFLTLLRLRCPR